MRADLRDVLLEAPPLERAACVRHLLDLGWAPSRILAEAPGLPPELVADGDASRDARPVSVARLRVAPSGN
jgi:hypothetical protein